VAFRYAGVQTLGELHGNENVLLPDQDQRGDLDAGQRTVASCA